MTYQGVVFIWALVATLALASASNSSSTAQCTNGPLRPTVAIDSGVVAGTTASIPSSNITVAKYLGIPFAERPVRFSPPVRARPWDGVYDASEYKPACNQVFRGTGEEREERIRQFNTPPPPAGEDEDCLNINVYAPAGAEPGSRPVLFWIFGGNLQFGTGSLPLYNSTEFVAFEDVVIVTSNYRTNIFGFPGSPDLLNGTQNPGLLDQRLALDWTRRNIAAFGGNPDKITLFGESAGGGSIDYILTSPPLPIPFRGAIIQSNQGSIRLSPNNGSRRAWDDLTKLVGCDCEDSLACMRTVPAKELVRRVEEQDMVFEPEEDGGVTLASNLRQRRLNSEEQPWSFARVPVMVGTNADEGRFSNLRNVTLDQVLAMSGIPEDVTEIIGAQYPIGSPGITDEWDRVTVLLTELLALCPMRYFTDDNRAVGIDTWRYFFDAAFPNSEIFERSGAYHTAELELVFGTYDEEGSTAYQRRLSRDMQTAWARFARDPAAGPGWDAVPAVAVLGGGVREGDEESPEETISMVQENDLDARCILFRSLYHIE
ncbi:cholinesterase [Stachybotrys elegans]|uniref:Carboxylic ester hydrolase n=1 Tax=Stachybotrys elegans TaxID=80388 RepID=A0A8K0WP48_9HYPO|nr:cholinesterase [Stachybotrys elegans]